MTQAGHAAVSVPTLAIVSVVLGAAVAAVTLAFVPVIALAVATGAAGLAAPMVVIGWRAGRLRRESRDIWPDAVDHLVSALRSGLALPDAVATLAHTGPARIRDAFAEFARDYRATAHFDRCLDRLKDRLADPVADRILETLRMSREVGGSELPSVLRGLASYLRQDVAVRGEVEARQSWVRNAARLGAAAPWVVLVLLATRPEAAIAYNSTTGAILIVVGFGVTVLAYRLMVAVARLPEERRWFR
jgi:tight adherence protein B